MVLILAPAILVLVFFRSTYRFVPPLHRGGGVRAPCYAAAGRRRRPTGA